MKKQTERVLTKEQACDLRVLAFLIAGFEYKSGRALHSSISTEEYDKLENDRLKAYDKFNEFLDSLTIEVAK